MEVKIVDRVTFLAMPAGTLFSKFEPYLFGRLAIKGDSTSLGTDFFYQGIEDAVANDSTETFVSQIDLALAGQSIPIDLDYEGRDGLFDKDQLFAVWEPDDVRALIARLQATLPEAGA